MEPLRPLNKAGFTDVLDYGVFLFKKHFRKLFFINLLFNLPLMILLAFINPVFSDQYWSFMNPYDMIRSGEVFSSIFTLYAMIFGALFLNGLYYITFKNVLDGSIIKMLYADVVLNQEKSLRQVIRECFSQFGTMMLGRFLYILIQCLIFFVIYVFIIIAVLGGTFAFMGITTVSFTTPWLSVALAILGILCALAILIFLVLVAGYYSGRYWMFLPTICIEQQKAGSSFSRCNNLGKNSFYLIGLSYIVGALLVGLFPAIINAVILFVSEISGNMDVGLYRVGAVITQIFSAILQPLFICILTVLYITLRVKREGLDMEMTLWMLKKEEREQAQRWTAEAPYAAK